MSFNTKSKSFKKKEKAEGESKAGAAAEKKKGMQKIKKLKTIFPKQKTQLREMLPKKLSIFIINITLIALQMIQLWK